MEFEGGVAMDFSLDEVDLGFVVNLETLRDVLKAMSVNGRKWWIASDPGDAIDTHTVTIGHGDPGCHDRLNTLYYHVPVLNEEMPMAGTDKLTLMLDSSVVSAEQPGLYFEDGKVGQDSVADLKSFFDPIQRALLAKLQSSLTIAGGATPNGLGALLTSNPIRRRAEQ
jgi:hypothetical protein